MENDSSSKWNQLGISELVQHGHDLTAAGAFLEAARAYQLALQRDPESVDAHFGRALLLLTLGKWKEGFAEYEWRKRRPQCDLVQYPLPLWRGETRPQGHLLIQCEQGLGDSIQFARYLPLAAKRVGKISLVCQPQLRQLFSCFEPTISLLSSGETVEAIDFWSPLLSLPMIFETTPENVPPPLDFLAGLSEKIPAPEVMKPNRPRRIGLAWRTDKSSASQERKSFSLKNLLPLAELPGIEWISLQKGMRPEEAALFRSAFKSEPDENKLADFIDTARCIKELDRVITLDSAVAHLAGSIARETWILLSDYPDWRWLLERSDSPWYPRAKLFRCKQAQKWGEVIEECKRELEAMLLRR